MHRARSHAAVPSTAAQPSAARASHAYARARSPSRRDSAVRIARRRQTRKYGDNWKASLAQLKKQRVHKETLLKEIKFQMELFNLHIQQGRDLCYKLSNPGLASTIKTAPAQLQAQLAIEVVSPILANANNPLTVVR